MKDIFIRYGYLGWHSSLSLFLKMLLHCLIFWCGEIASLLFFVLSVVCNFLIAFKIFFLITSFPQFGYDVLWVVFFMFIELASICHCMFSSNLVNSGPFCLKVFFSVCFLQPHIFLLLGFHPFLQCWVSHWCSGVFCLFYLG